VELCTLLKAVLHEEQTNSLKNLQAQTERSWCVRKIGEENAFTHDNLSPKAGQEQTKNGSLQKSDNFLFFFWFIIMVVIMLVLFCFVSPDAVIGFFLGILFVGLTLWLFPSKKVG
jgi:hypothetical protein